MIIYIKAVSKFVFVVVKCHSLHLWSVLESVTVQNNNLLLLSWRHHSLQLCAQQWWCNHNESNEGLRILNQGSGRACFSHIYRQDMLLNLFLFLLNADHELQHKNSNSGTPLTSVMKVDAVDLHTVCISFLGPCMPCLLLSIASWYSKCKAIPWIRCGGP